MKHIPLSFLFILITYCSYSQFPINNEGLALFNDGTRLLNLGDYADAETTLSQALCFFKDENVYYNRGISRLMQRDTIGFCYDIGIAANIYLDTGAARLFNQYCCYKVDTIYYDKKLNLTSDNDYQYYEEIRYLKYRTDTTGVFHDLKSKETSFFCDYGCENDLIGINLKESNIIAIYHIKDTRKYYTLSTKLPQIKSRIDYEAFKRRVKRLLRINYGELKTNNNIKELTVSVELTFAKSGFIADVKYIGLSPDISMGDTEENLKNEVIEIYNQFPRIKPASFKGENVVFVMRDNAKY